MIGLPNIGGTARTRRRCCIQTKSFAQRKGSDFARNAFWFRSARSALAAAPDHRPSAAILRCRLCRTGIARAVKQHQRHQPRRAARQAGDGGSAETSSGSTGRRAERRGSCRSRTAEALCCRCHGRGRCRSRSAANWINQCAMREKFRNPRDSAAPACPNGPGLRARTGGAACCRARPRNPGQPAPTSCPQMSAPARPRSHRGSARMSRAEGLANSRWAA